MRWRLKVRSYLVVLVLAALFPVVTFAAIAIVRLADLERATSEQAMREMARALSLAVDRELTGARSALLFLAVSPRLRSGDLESFHRQAADALTLRGASIVLAEPSGRERLNTARPFGAEGARAAGGDELEAVRTVGASCFHHLPRSVVPTPPRVSGLVDSPPDTEVSPDTAVSIREGKARMRYAKRPLVCPARRRRATKPPTSRSPAMATWVHSDSVGTAMVSKIAATAT